VCRYAAIQSDYVPEQCMALPGRLIGDCVLWMLWLLQGTGSCRWWQREKKIGECLQALGTEWLCGISASVGSSDVCSTLEQHIGLRWNI